MRSGSQRSRTRCGRAVFRREKELAADIRNAADAARRLVLILRDLILREHAGREGQQCEHAGIVSVGDAWEKRFPVN